MVGELAAAATPTAVAVGSGGWGVAWTAIAASTAAAAVWWRHGDLCSGDSISSTSSNEVHCFYNLPMFVLLTMCKAADSGGFSV